MLDGPMEKPFKGGRISIKVESPEDNALRTTSVPLRSLLLCRHACPTKNCCCYNTIHTVALRIADLSGFSEFIKFLNARGCEMKKSLIGVEISW